MNVLVFGATGKTGRLVVDRALAQGHRVSALIRHPATYNVQGVNVFHGDATNRGDVLSAMPGHDAVIDTIGGTKPFLNQTFERDAVHNILEAMQAENIERLIVVTMMGLGESAVQAPFWYKNFLMPTFLRGSTADKRALEAELRASPLAYTIVRPPFLTDAPSAGPARIFPPPVPARKITRTDLANFLVDRLTSDLYLRQAVTVANT